MFWVYDGGTEITEVKHGGTDIIKRKEKEGTGFSEGWQGCHEGSLASPRKTQSLLTLFLSITLYIIYKSSLLGWNELR